MNDIEMLGKVDIDDVEFHQIAKLNAFGELIVVALDIGSGAQTEFMLDAVATRNLYAVLHRFNQGNFRGLDETP